MDSKIYPETFAEAYEKYKDLIDASIPKDVIIRLLENEGIQEHGDAWEGDEPCPF